MPTSSQKLAEHYRLDLNEPWRKWFDHDLLRLKLPGMMRQPLSVEELCQPAPEAIWPGFMLPDSLPLVGNKYGDWICARISEQNEFGELVYWYHGGGDWIPVGSFMAECILHDAVDQFREVRTQMIRGATESRVDSQAGVLLRLSAEPMLDWLVEQLARSPSISGDTSQLNGDLHEAPEHGNRAGSAESLAAAKLDELIGSLSQMQYEPALRLLLKNRWAVEAVSCDLNEACLQLPIIELASKEVASLVSLPWFPDFVGLLFDIEQMPQSLREQILAAPNLDLREWDLREWPKQDWSCAGRLSRDIFARRQDLGWATNISGWVNEKQGDIERALDIYSRGVRASSFTDQSVRFNSHADSEEYGKFAAARLAALRDYWPRELHDDSYIGVLTQHRKRSLLVDVSEYWQASARQSEAAGLFPEAYDQYLAWGWDLGVSRLSDYVEILEGLRRCAAQAGWQARAAVAETHLRCLQRTTR